MSRPRLDAIRERLSDRDLAILADVDRFRLLGTRQIQRLHFAEGHETEGAATRACVRVLGRLRDEGLLTCLERRIGGVRRGSSGLVWYLAAVGERLQRDLRGLSSRRRYGEPSRHFVQHTLAVADCAVRLIEISRTGVIDIVRMQTEPDCWLPYLSGHGTKQWLKPDLAVVAINGDFEDHFFIEVDLATEHLPVVLRQCTAYSAYRRTGRHQKAHGLFPAVVWVTPTRERANAVRRAIDAQSDIAASAFRVCIDHDFVTTITGYDDPRSRPE